MTVATAFAVSWNPLTNSKLRARPTARMRKNRVLESFGATLARSKQIIG
jgi:hypothetical protein